MFLPFITTADDIADLDQLKVKAEGGCYYMRAPFAYSDDGRWLTSIDVGLRPAVDAAPIEDLGPFSFHEFAYEITIADRWGQHDLESTMEPYRARLWLPPDNRRMVLEVVGACCHSLLQMFEPQIIYRRTLTEHPSAKSLRRYDFVTKVMESEGYRLLRAGTHLNGCRFWLMGLDGIDLSDLL